MCAVQASELVPSTYTTFRSLQPANSRALLRDPVQSGWTREQLVAHVQTQDSARERQERDCACVCTCVCVCVRGSSARMGTAHRHRTFYQPRAATSLWALRLSLGPLAASLLTSASAFGTKKRVCVESTKDMRPLSAFLIVCLTLWASMRTTSPGPVTISAFSSGQTRVASPPRDKHKASNCASVSTRTKRGGARGRESPRGDRWCHCAPSICWSH